MDQGRKRGLGILGTACLVVFVGFALFCGLHIYRFIITENAYDEIDHAYFVSEHVEYAFLAAVSANNGIVPDLRDPAKAKLLLMPHMNTTLRGRSFEEANALSTIKFPEGYKWNPDLIGHRYKAITNKEETWYFKYGPPGYIMKRNNSFFGRSYVNLPQAKVEFDPRLDVGGTGLLDNGLVRIAEVDLTLSERVQRHLNYAGIKTDDKYGPVDVRPVDKDKAIKILKDDSAKMRYNVYW